MCKSRSSSSNNNNKCLCPRVPVDRSIRKYRHSNKYLSTLASAIAVHGDLRRRDGSVVSELESRDLLLREEQDLSNIPNSATLDSLSPKEDGFEENGLSPVSFFSITEGFDDFVDDDDTMTQQELSENKEAIELRS